MVEGVAVVVVDVLGKAVAHVNALGGEELPVAVKRAAAEEADDLQVLGLDLRLLLSLLVGLVVGVDSLHAFGDLVVSRKTRTGLCAGVTIEGIAVNVMRGNSIGYLGAEPGTLGASKLLARSVFLAALEDSDEAQIGGLNLLRLLLGLVLGHVVHINRGYAL